MARPFHYMILQAITDGGAISANWVLVGAFTAIGVLLLFMARMISNHVITALKEMNIKIEGHDDRIGSLEINHTKHDGELINLRRERDDTLDKIYATLEVLKNK